jgi:hypothetical protein
MAILIVFFFSAWLSFAPSALATEDYHFVGWFNAFVPGGGQFLMGNDWTGGEQAALEITTFGVGYSLSAERHFTIDGVTEEYPYYTNDSHVNLNKPLAGALLQEIGIKAHMVNVFDAYREAHDQYGGDAGQGIDDRPALELFKDPFRWEVVSSPWVWIPLIAVAGATALDYRSQIQNGQPRLEKLTPFSNSFVGFNQLAVYPVGSGAPEEMFYRGFLQNEAYQAVRSPFFAIPISTLAFSFSHAPKIVRALPSAAFTWVFSPLKITEIWPKALPCIFGRW